MESIITSNIKSFVFSNGLISDHQFGFRAGHSTLDMLLLLSQQWTEALNARQEIRAVSLDISRAFDTVWHPALLNKLSSHGIQGHLHSWLADFLSCRSHRVALNGVLSSPLPVQAGVPQGSVLGPVPFLVFINDLSDSLENPLFLFADDSTLCRTIGHPSSQAAASSLTADLDKITNWSNTWNMSFNPDKSHTLTMSFRKDHLEPPHPHQLSQQSTGRSPFFQASGSHYLP